MDYIPQPTSFKDDHTATAASISASPVTNVSDVSRARGYRTAVGIVLATPGSVKSLRDSASSKLVEGSRMSVLPKAAVVMCFRLYGHQMMALEFDQILLEMGLFDAPTRQCGRGEERRQVYFLEAGVKKIYRRNHRLQGLAIRSCYGAEASP
ncbi:hypothetical protein LTR22_000021 [Elasticomyces elasticus]|nr:hypothetical protein LTR22_000021 [Elasticomyces elasticus]